jgi:hypothetical protein
MTIQITHIASEYEIPVWLEDSAPEDESEVCGSDCRHDDDPNGGDGMDD